MADPTDSDADNDTKALSTSRTFNKAVIGALLVIIALCTATFIKVAQLTTASTATPAKTTTTRPPTPSPRPSPTTPTTPTARTPPVATTTSPPTTAAFTVAGGTITGPDGMTFIPVGANVGADANNFGWNGDAKGHSDSAQAWGWNMVRVNAEFAPQWQPTASTVADVEAVADEFTAKRVVVDIASHDTLDAPTQAIVRRVFTRLATRYKNNPYVWFNFVNEPAAATVTAWLSLEQGYVNLVRGTGANNVIVADAIGDAEDAPWDGAYLVDYAPQLVGSNIIFAIHNYGSYQTEAAYSAHTDALHAQNISVLTEETGYKVPPNENAGNKAGTLASFADRDHGVGVLVWHGTFGGDGFDLRVKSNPYYSTAALTDMGQKLWALTH